MYELYDHNSPVYDTRMIMIFGPKGGNLKSICYGLIQNHLIDTSCFILDSFDFDSVSAIISAKKYITLNYWKFIFTSFNVICNVLHIISTLTIVTLKKTKRK